MVVGGGTASSSFVIALFILGYETKDVEDLQSSTCIALICACHSDHPAPPLPPPPPPPPACLPANLTTLPHHHRRRRHHHHRRRRRHARTFVHVQPFVQRLGELWLLRIQDFIVMSRNSCGEEMALRSTDWQQPNAMRTEKGAERTRVREDHAQASSYSQQPATGSIQRRIAQWSCTRQDQDLS